MVIGIPSLEMSYKLCGGCLVGKQSKKSFVSTMPMRSSCILEVVHSDNSSNVIGNLLISYDFNEESQDVKVEDIVDIPVEVEAKNDMPDTVKIEDGVTSTGQRPQRARPRPARLQDYEVTGDNEVTPDG
ncbi:hypothetical protein KIW84_053021 [Lathyrus oleraceus]|uniref:Uncharacterized protein n=1 Tax=Pisum sativum TaxID=3888 RepID=A0A9D5ACQ8_PEA|nr:hypothetical protein KIW84_053021 [Pisum sativum]